MLTSYIDLKIGWLQRPLTGNLVWQTVQQWIIQVTPTISLFGLLLLSGCNTEDAVPAGTVNLDGLPVNVPEPVLNVERSTRCNNSATRLGGPLIIRDE